MSSNDLEYRHKGRERGSVRSPPSTLPWGVLSTQVMSCPLKTTHFRLSVLPYFLLFVLFALFLLSHQYSSSLPSPSYPHSSFPSLSPSQIPSYIPPLFFFFLTPKKVSQAKEQLSFLIQEKWRKLGKGGQRDAWGRSVLVQDKDSKMLRKCEHEEI